MAGYGLWKAHFTDSGKVLYLSQGEAEAWDLVSKSRFIWEHLPEEWRLPIDRTARGEMNWHGNYSEIKALASTAPAGRGTDASLVARDELAQHPYGKENFTAINPAIDAGGQDIDLSTIYKLDEENHFTDRVNKAMDGAKRIDLPSGLVVFEGGRSGATLVFCGWKLRPVREEGLSLEQWFNDVIKPKYDAFEIEQEYPATIEEALSTPDVICRFDKLALQDMLNDCRGIQPIRTERNGLVKIYKDPVAGRRYTLPVDPSEGVEDPSCGAVIDAKTDEAVVTFSVRVPINEQAVIIYDLYQRYYEPYTAPERNASGLALINQLINLGVKNFHYYDKSRQKAGWWTSSASRPLMITELAELVRLRALRIPNPEAIEQFKSFVRTKEHPDGIAVGGRHDDWVIVWGIHSQIRKSVPTGGIKVTSVKYG